jgi:hypothetical protein
MRRCLADTQRYSSSSDIDNFLSLKDTSEEFKDRIIHIFQLSDVSLVNKIWGCPR